jgi:hypothetical protein
LTTLDTVFGDTPAAIATSRIVTGRRSVSTSPVSS